MPKHCPSVSWSTRHGSKPVGSQIVREDGRPFTVTAAVRRSRKLQGQYLGNLRKLSQNERDKIKAMAKEKGVAAAVAAMVARHGKT